MFYKSEEKKKYIKKYLKLNLSHSRFQHSLNVANECRKLAEKYDENPDKAYFAGLLHDICKELPFEEQLKYMKKNDFAICCEEFDNHLLWHAIAGASFVKEQFNVEDIDIINSIRFHTVGRAWMSRFEKIVYIGDFISSDRNFKDVDKLRKLVYNDLNSVILSKFSYSINTVKKKCGIIPSYTVEGYNFYTCLLKCFKYINN